MDEVGYLTTDTLWDALLGQDDPPARLAILGGGPIGCELAQAFARLGSNVTLIERGERLMALEDADAAEIVSSHLEADGVRVLTEHSVLKCARDNDQKFLVAKYKGLEYRFEFDVLICTVGRRARLSGYGLEALGIPTQRTICTNEYLETLYPNIYAAGDVAGPFQFTHTAAHMAWYATVNALFGQFKRFKVDYSVIPRTTFVDPEVARVGLNEQDAKEQGVLYEVTRFEISDLDRAITDSTRCGFVKVLTVPGKDRILGVTIVGAQAGELLAEYVLAMRCGLGLNKILGTIHSYLTMAEANKYAAGEWKKAHAPVALLRILAHYHRWRRGRSAV